MGYFDKGSCCTRLVTTQNPQKGQERWLTLIPCPLTCMPVVSPTTTRILKIWRTEDDTGPRLQHVHRQAHPHTHTPHPHATHTHLLYTHTKLKGNLCWSLASHVDALNARSVGSLLETVGETSGPSWPVLGKAERMMGHR